MSHQLPFSGRCAFAIVGWAGGLSLSQQALAMAQAPSCVALLKNKRKR